VLYGKRVVFASTSEVYGMCPDPEFDEETSPLVYGPIRKQRWIYSCSKQLLDRVIWAYGQAEGLRFTLFRPFNWIGPHLDDIDSPKEGSSRVLTQFLHNILYGQPIKLVDGGRQRRSFTYISDGIDCLMRILENHAGAADGGIFNIGNPANDLSVAELAERLIETVAAHPEFGEKARRTPIVNVSSGDYYGEGYQDILTRVPSIRRAREILGWEPKVSLDEALRLTVDFYLSKRPAR
jgi:nucleoside-diphosphate-sugar epimerase